VYKEILSEKDQIDKRVDLAFGHVNDSGERQEFDTGSQRDTREGKGRYDLMSPIVMKRDAVLLENGAKKYGDRNWEKGQPLSRMFDSAIRHMYSYMGGDRSEDHLTQARWNIGCMVHIEELVRRGQLPTELTDLPKTLEEVKEDADEAYQATVRREMSTQSGLDHE
jgi:hypothetical protein